MAKKKSKPKDHTKTALIIILAVVIALGGIYLYKNQTKEELTTGEETEYTFNGHHFVKVDNLWYTLVKSSDKKVAMEVALHYGPKQLQDFPVSGDPRSVLPVEKGYVSFDPLEPELRYVMLANGELSLTLAKAFKGVQNQPLNLTTVCSRDDGKSCSKYPIINCNTTNKTVISLKQVNQTGIVVRDNCIRVQGKNEELVKGVDRLMYSWFGILP